MPPPLTVLIADDHAVVRDGIKAMLALHPEFHVIAEAANGTEALHKHQQHQPDLTLLDVRMPGTLDGLQALVAIRQRRPQARIIMLASDDFESHLHTARRAGASGFLLKSTTREALVAALLQAHRTGFCSPYDQPVSGNPPELTSRELEALEHLRRGLSNSEIGRALGISEQTVLSHLKTLFSKLEVANRTEAVSEGFQRGYLRL